ncbi:hypothetical protein HT051_11635 [Methyloligella sp. GL2]|nr:hypothetical protein HT051_11635 [Methyloligella sp. GL2]
MVMLTVALMLALTVAAGPAAAASCKSYYSCEQAVRAWCAGTHPRADGDGDGIPCENVCPTRAIVKAIEAEIGCSR